MGKLVTYSFWSRGEVMERARFWSLICCRGRRTTSAPWAAHVWIVSDSQVNLETMTHELIVAVDGFGARAEARAAVVHEHVRAGVQDRREPGGDGPDLYLAARGEFRDCGTLVREVWERNSELGGRAC